MSPRQAWWGAQSCHSKSACVRGFCLDPAQGTRGSLCFAILTSLALNCVEHHSPRPLYCCFRPEHFSKICVGSKQLSTSTCPYSWWECGFLKEFLLQQYHRKKHSLKISMLCPVKWTNTWPLIGWVGFASIYSLLEVNDITRAVSLYCVLKNQWRHESHVCPGPVTPEIVHKISISSKKNQMQNTAVKNSMWKCSPSQIS